VDLRLRMVLVGLVIGIVVAIAVAANGCGHHKRPLRHGSANAATSSAGPARASPNGEQARKRPFRRPNARGAFFSWHHGQVARVDAPRGRMVALTFDDGPGIDTAAILDALRRMHARATFFVIGSMAAANPEMVRAIRRAGMQIGNHTWSHTQLPELSPAAQLDELERAQAVLTRITHVRPRFFRPPNWRFGERAARAAAREGLIGVMRTVDTRDWTLPGTAEIVRRALRVGAGGVVAMHDGGGSTRAQTAAAVPLIVRGLRRRGLRPVTVAELYRG
jgi:peptidoglycan/xylan/chitin deacetylase (PgdA/CDA1 family)